MLTVFTIVGPAAQHGWLAGRTLALGACSLGLFSGFILRQRTARNPLIPLRIFSSRNLAGANLVQVLGTAGMFGMFFLGSLYLRLVLGYDALHIGLAFLPVTVTMGTLSVRYTDRLVMRFGTRGTMFSGLGLIAAALALFALAPEGAGYLSHIFPVTLLMGIGSGLCFPALMALAMSSATPQDAGLASGLVNKTAQVGGALGLAVLATVSAARSNSLIAQHHPAAAALTDGYHLAFWIRMRPGGRGRRAGSPRAAPAAWHPARRPAGARTRTCRPSRLTAISANGLWPSSLRHPAAAGCCARPRDAGGSLCVIGQTGIPVGAPAAGGAVKDCP